MCPRRTLLINGGVFAAHQQFKNSGHFLFSGLPLQEFALCTTILNIINSPRKVIFATQSNLRVTRINRTRFENSK